MYAPETSDSNVEVRAWKSSFAPAGMWKLAAQPPHDCFVSSSQSGEHSRRTATWATGLLAPTLTCTHQSLPFTPPKVASKGTVSPGHATSWASVSLAGIHLRQELR